MTATDTDDCYVVTVVIFGGASLDCLPYSVHDSLILRWKYHHLLPVFGLLVEIRQINHHLLAALLLVAGLLLCATAVV